MQIFNPEGVEFEELPLIKEKFIMNNPRTNKINQEKKANSLSQKIMKNVNYPDPSQIIIYDGSR